LHENFNLAIKGSKAHTKNLETALKINGGNKMTGKKIRLERIMDRDTRKMLIVPMDHGVSEGPIKGLINMGESVDKAAEGGANAVVGHIGLAMYGHRGSGKDIGLILHLSASTKYAPDPNKKVLVNTVENALKMGADCVSVHVNIGAEYESEMLQDLGKIAVDCMEWGMPLLVMIYPRGKKIENEKDAEAVALAARVAAELGADVVKVPYTGSKESFEKVVAGCPAPVVIAGGSKGDDKDILKMIKDAIDSGASGVAMGRNSFQHDEPGKFIKAVSLIIHKLYEVEDAMDEAGLK
jgi:fructose-bisphosphate aldolase / 2-amino-3,7-dideoxy-D-threo-hept-6-ulosonate synthase